MFQFWYLRWARPNYKLQNSRGGQNDNDYHDHDMDDEDMRDMKSESQPKLDYWNGYYDFLINEGSYKFWAVFQVNKLFSIHIYML